MIFDHHLSKVILILFKSEWGEIPSFIAVSSFGEVSIEYPHHPMETYPLNQHLSVIIRLQFYGSFGISRGLTGI